MQYSNLKIIDTLKRDSIVMPNSITQEIKTIPNDNRDINGSQTRKFKTASISKRNNIPQ